MTGDALEQALALQRAPLLRFSLRDRPLAPGITRVIQLAAASQPLLADTAARLGLTEDGVLEAVRFYLQQVLFEGEPEAYRSLGAAPAASTDEIREHFRWLQRWLHPDRHGDAWESVFTTRVNWAWSQLRTEAARAAYDAHCAGDAPPVAADHAPVAAAATGWKAVPVARPPSPHRFLRRATLAAGFMACCGLFYLALTRQDHPRTVALGAALPGEATTDTRVPATVASVPRRESTGDELAAGNVLRADTPAVALAPAGQMAPLSSDAVPASASIPLPAAPLAVAEPSLAQAAPVTPAPVESPAVPLPASRRQRAITHRSRPAAPAAVEPALTAQADSSRHAGASGNTVSAQAVNQTPVIAPAEVPEAATELATTKDEVPLPLMPASVGEPVAERAATTKKVAPAELLTRMSLARQRVRDLVRFFRRQDRGDLGGPDAQGADSAQHSRHALRQRIGVATAAHFALDPPTWQVSAEQAVLDADYRVARRSRVAERGRFRVDMVWDDNQWRLTRVALEPER